MNTVNLKQLAKELNLSVSTVSRALRDSWEISTPTKQRVFDLAKKMKKPVTSVVNELLISPILRREP